jgi:hypothetical protein
MKTLKTLDEYIQRLIEIACEQTGMDKSDIKINRDEANKYFESGIPAYYCFREEFNA